MQILSQTPTWVFVLVAGLLVFGLLQRRDRTVRKPVVYLLPLAMVAFSLAGVQSGFGLRTVPVAAWLAGLLLVTVAARRAFRRSALSYDRKRNRFFIPGSWVPLVVIMGIFLTRYAAAVRRRDHASEPTPLRGTV